MLTSIDHAEQIAFGIGEYDEVGVVGIDPVRHPLGSERYEALDLGPLFFGIRSVEVEVHPVVLVQEQGRAVTVLWYERRRVAAARRVAERLTPELRRPRDIRYVQHDRSNSNHRRIIARNKPECTRVRLHRRRAVCNWTICARGRWAFAICLTS